MVIVYTETPAGWAVPSASITPRFEATLTVARTVDMFGPKYPVTTVCEQPTWYASTENAPPGTPGVTVVVIGGGVALAVTVTGSGVGVSVISTGVSVTSGETSSAVAVSGSAVKVG